MVNNLFRFCMYIELSFSFLEVTSIILVEILKLGLVKILNLKFSQDADVWLRF